MKHYHAGSVEKQPIPDLHAPRRSRWTIPDDALRAAIVEFAAGDIRAGRERLLADPYDAVAAAYEVGMRVAWAIAYHAPELLRWCYEYELADCAERWDENPDALRDSDADMTRGFGSLIAKHGGYGQERGNG